jgi:hypothetical protein
VLDLVLELGELGDNLLALVLLGGVVAGAHGAVGIVNRLGLKGFGIRTCPRMEMKMMWTTTDNDDGPSCPGRLVGERRRVARRVGRRCGIGLVLGIGSNDDSIHTKLGVELHLEDLVRHYSVWGVRQREDGIWELQCFGGVALEGPTWNRDSDIGLGVKGPGDAPAGP